MVNKFLNVSEKIGKRKTGLVGVKAFGEPDAEFCYEGVRLFSADADLTLIAERDR